MSQVPELLFLFFSLPSHPFSFTVGTQHQGTEPLPPDWDARLEKFLQILWVER